MKRAMVVCDNEKSTAFYLELLKSLFIHDVLVATDGADALRKLGEYDIDICIVNGPIRMQSGEQLAIDLADKNTSQVILFIKTDQLAGMEDTLMQHGVFTVAKPVVKSLAENAIINGLCAQGRIDMMKKENTKLVRRMEDLKVISKAKCLLVSALGLDEEGAHRYLEKEAMDLRSTRIDVAKSVIERYGK